MTAIKSSIASNLKSHSVLLIVFVLVVLGIIVWKLTPPYAWMGEKFLDAGLAEIRTQVLASAAKKQTHERFTTNINNCPLRNSATFISGNGVAPCFLGLKDIAPNSGNSLKPLPELAPVTPRQYPKCIRCENVLNRAINIIPSNGAFTLGHFLAKKKDSNSIVIIPDLISNSAVRHVTDGNFRLIMGLSDPHKGVTIYHPESDCVIARDAVGRVALAPISDFSGSLAPAATFELVDGPINYSTCAFKCMPINKESPNKYLGFAAGTMPGSMPLTVISFINGNKTLPTGITFEFDLVDLETGVPVIMNKHSGLVCQELESGYGKNEGFTSGDINDTDANFETRDKRIVGGFIQEKELSDSEIRQLDTNENSQNNNSHVEVSGYRQEIQGMKPANLELLLGGLPQLGEKVINSMAKLPDVIDRPFATENFINSKDTNNSAGNAVGMLPITLDELGHVPDNLFEPASGLAFNNALNVQNQVYKEQLGDTVFQKLNAAKMSPSVQNILDYNSTAYKVYQDENQNFANKINTQNRTNTDRLNDVIAELDKQRVIGMSKELFFMKNQFEKANAKPAAKN